MSDTSEEESDDFEEVTEAEYLIARHEQDKIQEKILQEEVAKMKIPETGIKITLDEGVNKVSVRKKFDKEAYRRRVVNYINRYNQVFIHQTHLVCLLARGLYINNVLKSEEILALALSVLPSKQAYPPPHADLTYLESFIKWFKKTFIVMEEELDQKSKDSVVGLKESIISQLNSKRVISNDHLAYVFVVILRALSLKVRVITSLQPSPLRLPSELVLKDPKKKGNQGRKRKKSNDEVEEISLLSDEDENLVDLDQPGPSSRSRSSTSKKVKSKSKTKREKKVVVKKDSSYSDLNSEDDKRKSKRSSSRKGKDKSKAIKEERDKKDSHKAHRSDRSKVKDDDEPKLKKGKSIVKKEKDTSNSEKGGRRSIRSTRNQVKDEPILKKVKLDVKEEKEDERSRRNQVKNQPKSKKVKLDVKEEKEDEPSRRNQVKNQPKSKKVKLEVKKEKEDDNHSDFDPQQDSSSDDDSDFDMEKSWSSQGRKKKVPTPETKSVKSEKKASKTGGAKNAGEVKARQYYDIWAEVYLEEEERWVSVNLLTGKIMCDKEFEPKASKPLTYVLAFGNESQVKDVTRRYASRWLTATQKIRVDKSWWTNTLRPFRGRRTREDKEEDELLDQHFLNEAVPTSIAELKGHPLYVLRRHLLKFEAIYPPEPLSLGFIKTEPIYARECVKTLHSRELWLRRAKVVRLGETPYKIVKSRPKWDKSTSQIIKDIPLELFGEWQVEDYIPPEAKGGKVPRNEYGNVELFMDKMLPKGTIHMKEPGLNRVAKKLNIDCAPALTGFDFHAGGSHPTFDGFIVCEEFKDLLLDACRQEQEEARKRARQKVLKRVRENWRRLIRMVIIKRRLERRYDTFNFDKNPSNELPSNKRPSTATSSAKSSSKPKPAKRSRKK